MKILECEEVGGNILANRRVRAATGFDCAYPLGLERIVAHQKLSVLFGENVIRHGGDVQLFAEALTELQHQCGLAAAHGPADADGEGALVEVSIKGRITFVKVPGVLEMFVRVTVVAVVVMMWVHRRNGLIEDAQFAVGFAQLATQIKTEVVPQLEFDLGMRSVKPIEIFELQQIALRNGVGDDRC